MSRMRSLHSGGWVVIFLFLLQGAGFGASPQSATADNQFLPARFVAEQRKVRTTNPMSTVPSADNTQLHFQESFASRDYLAYNAGTHWDIVSQQLALQLQDNVGQQDVVIASATAGGGAHHLYVVWQDLRIDSGDIYVQKLDGNGNRLWPADQRVNNDDGHATQFSPSAVVDAAGNLLVAWVDNRNGNNDIYLQRLDTQGKTLWAEDLRLHDDAGLAEQGAPALAIDAAGVTVVAWHDNRAGDYDVYLQQLDGNGVRRWTTDLRVNQDNSYTAQTYPAISVEANGTIVLAWLDRRIGNGDLYLQRVSSQGGLLWAQEVRINQATEQTENRPALAQLASGGIVVSWLDLLDQHIYLQSLDQQGNRRWMNTVRANQFDLPANQNRSPALMQQGNNLLVAWERAQDQAIYVQSLTNQGALQWPTERRIITGAGVVMSNARFVTLAAGAEQRLMVAWSDQRDHAHGDIYTQAFDAQGARIWRADARVDDAAGTVDQTLADVTTTADGSSTLVWQDQRFETVPQLYLQRVMPDGRLRWTHALPVHQASLIRHKQYSPQIANLGDDTLVAWSDATSSGTHIYLQRIDPAGNRLWVIPHSVGDGSTVQSNPALAVNPPADVFVAWETTQAGVTQIAVLRLNASGEAQWSTPTNLMFTNGASRLPDLATDAEGNVYVTWLVTMDEGTDLYLQKINHAGGLVWPAPVLVNSAQGLVNRFNAPRLVTSAAGVSIIVWVDNRQAGVYAQSIDSAGQRLWTRDVLLNPSGGTFSPTPAIAAAPAGGAVIVWQTFNQGVAAIKAQQITAAGALLWNGINGLETTVSEGGQQVAAPRVATDGQGASYITWGDERRNNPDIFMQRLDSAGQRTWPTDQAIVQPDQFYQAAGTVESHTIDSAEQPVRQATLTADLDLHGGAIEFMLTNNGATWQHAQLGERIVFTTTGSDLRWQAQLHADPHNFATSPVIRSLQIDYDTALPLVSNDRYEVDDSCDKAQALQVNGGSQQHEFVASSSAMPDQDWAYVPARGGQKYILVATPNRRDAALQLELYANCGETALATAQSSGGHSAVLQWVPNNTNTHFVRVTATSSSTIVSALQTPLTYQLNVRTAITPGMAILVAGRLVDAPANQAAIDQTVDRVYQKLQQQGYSPAQIQYLGRNTGVTLQALQTAIQGWAVAQALAADDRPTPLIIYLAGRGAVDRFYLNGTESVTPELLSLWLANLEAQASIQPVTIILEARYAGSFITNGQTVSDTATLSAPNRVLVTATDATGSVWRTSQGLLFSDAFWTNLITGQTVQQSFLAAKQAIVEAGYFCQNSDVWCQAPWLDDNGDGAPNPSLAADLAQRQGLPAPSTQPPQIQAVYPIWNEATQTLAIEAQVLVSDPATQVEAHLMPWPYQPVIAADEVFPALQHPVLILKRVDEAPIEPATQLQIYRGVYPVPTQALSLWISVYAWDSAGLLALPFGVPIQNRFYTYLPIVSK